MAHPEYNTEIKHSDKITKNHPADTGGDRSHFKFSTSVDSVYHLIAPSGSNTLVSFEETMLAILPSLEPISTRSQS